MSASNSHVSRRAFLQFGRSASPVLADPQWDEVQARAARFGIVPGTRVDAQGRPLDASEEFLSEPLLGELICFAFDFAPRGYYACAGQLLLIQQNQALFSLLGTTFGGDGQTTFGLPDLRGRLPMGQGAGPDLTFRTMGESGGVESIALSTAQMPPHAHAVPSALAGSSASPVGAYFAPEPNGEAYAAATNPLVGATRPSGQGAAHANLPPFVVLNWCIAYTGLYPSRP